MIFGDSLHAAESTDPAEWIAGSLSGQPWTVGALVPNLFESVLRLHSPDPACDDWWELYRDLFGCVASVGARHSSTPTTAWFGIWEGHGFDTSTTHLAWTGPPAEDDERERREAQRERQRTANSERNTTIASALASVPRFDLPNRAYYLTRGSLSALTELRYPDRPGWRNPDLFWPNDRSWFAATDVDFWSLYIGGSKAFINELAAEAPTPCEFVDQDDPLPIEN